MLRYLSQLRFHISWVAITVVALNWEPTTGNAQTATATPRLVSTATAKPLNAPLEESDPLLQKLDTAISVTSRRYLTANYHSPWQIFHGLLALKRDFELKLGDSKVNAIDWIATSEPRFDNQPLLLKTPHGGKFHPFTRKWAFEGHPAQFLALLSQSDLPVDFKFKVGDGHITISDMVNNAMKEVNSHEEVTWVLWALQHYLAPNAKWVNQVNEPWSIERLVQIETMAPVVGAACGGNHRLFALTRARDKHLKYGGRLDGIWAQADLKVRQHIELARSLQNADGSFSSKSYQSAGFTSDLNERFNTTGHTMEFLSISIPDNRLNEPWVRNAISMMCHELIANHQRPIDCGPLYHSLNSLIIYRDRIRPLTTAVADSNSPKNAEPKKPEITVTPSSLPLAQSPVPLPKTNPSIFAEKSLGTSVAPMTKSDTITKSESLQLSESKVPQANIPSVQAPFSTASPNSATPITNASQPEAVRKDIDPKLIDPGRINTAPPAATSTKDTAPTVLPEAATELFELPTGDQESLDSTTGTIKPRIANPPPPSRIRITTSGQPVIRMKTGTDAVLNAEVDTPVSALEPANR